VRFSPACAAQRVPNGGRLRASIGLRSATGAERRPPARFSSACTAQRVPNGGRLRASIGLRGAMGAER
jgi:hypothetical protein